MNLIFTNKCLPFKKQDSQSTVLLLFFSLLPLTALLPHAHLFAALWVVLLLAAGMGYSKEKIPFLTGTDAKLYTLLLVLTLSGVVLASARAKTVLSVLLRLSFFLSPLFAKKEREIRRICAAVGAVTGGYAAVELLLGFGATNYNDPTLFPTLSRASAFFGNPNILAAFLLPCALFALEDALFEKKDSFFSWTCFLFGCVGIAATYSRGAILALCFGSFFLFLRRFGFFSVVLTLIAVLPLSLLLLPSTITERVFSVFSPDTSVLYRFSLWESVFRLPKRLLLFGVGEGKEAMLSALSPVLSAGLLHIEHTHSLFLHLLLSVGVFGLLIFLFIVAKVLLFGKKRGAAEALIAFLIFGIFDDPLYSGQTEVIFWLTLGFCADTPSSFCS